MAKNRLYSVNTSKCERTTLVCEIYQTLFFPALTQKEKIAVWPRETNNLCAPNYSTIHILYILNLPPYHKLHKDTVLLNLSYSFHP